MKNRENENILIQFKPCNFAKILMPCLILMPKSLQILKNYPSYKYGTNTTVKQTSCIVYRYYHLILIKV